MATDPLSWREAEQFALLLQLDETSPTVVLDAICSVPEHVVCRWPSGWRERALALRESALESKMPAREGPRWASRPFVTATMREAILALTCEFLEAQPELSNKELLEAVHARGYRVTEQVFIRIAADARRKLGIRRSNPMKGVRDPDSLSSRVEQLLREGLRTRREIAQALEDRWGMTPHKTSLYATFSRKRKLVLRGEGA